MPQSTESSPDPLRKLVEGIVRRDPATLSFLYESFAPALFGEIASVVEDLDSAVKILQKTIVYGVQHIHQYNPQLRLYTWFYQIARFKMLEKAVNEIIGKSLPDDLELSHYADAWSRLSPLEKDLLEQLIFKGRSREEVFARMKLSPDILQQLVFTALSRFHKSF